jgi:predicted DNA-binding transcriptional regulator AlpA
MDTTSTLAIVVTAAEFGAFLGGVSEKGIGYMSRHNPEFPKAIGNAKRNAGMSFKRSDVLAWKEKRDELKKNLVSGTEVASALRQKPSGIRRILKDDATFPKPVNGATEVSAMMFNKESLNAWFGDELFTVG